MDYSFIHKLEQELKKDLPGKLAQSLMAPAKREAYLNVQEDHMKACVLALLFPRKKDWHIAFIERNHQVDDKHSGQISLPGGKLQESDRSYTHCALRETEEEIGIDQNQVKILGKLTDLYVFVSNYKIFPFVGFYDSEPEFVRQESEVRSILEVPVSIFLSHEHKAFKDIHVRNLILKDVPYYNLDGHVLWGATAMMMSELNEVLISVKKK